MIKCTTKIKTTYVCPITDKEVTKEIEPIELSHMTLLSIYDDCDSGYELTARITCPECNQRHELDVLKDEPFGCR